MAKEIIRLRTGECVLRVVRDVDFMMLSDGRQYARCILNREEIEIARPRDAQGNGIGEWMPAAYFLETVGQVIDEKPDEDDGDSDWEYEADDNSYGTAKWT